MDQVTDDIDREARAGGRSEEQERAEATVAELRALLAEAMDTGSWLKPTTLLERARQALERTDPAAACECERGPATTCTACVNELRALRDEARNELEQLKNDGFATNDRLAHELRISRAETEEALAMVERLADLPHVRPALRSGDTARSDAYLVAVNAVVNARVLLARLRKP